MQSVTIDATTIPLDAGEHEIRVAYFENSGWATIALTGGVLLGGTCDAPHVQAQLQQTALQYRTVDEASITVNGQPLEDVLSGQ